MRQKKAFSITELMVTIALTAIIAALAVFSYSEYIVKSKIVQSINILETYAKKGQDYYIENGKFPTTMTELIGQASVTTTDAVISLKNQNSNVYFIATYNSSVPVEIANKVFFIEMSISNDEFTSKCGTNKTATKIDFQYLPHNCDLLINFS